MSPWMRPLAANWKRKPGSKMFTWNNCTPMGTPIGISIGVQIDKRNFRRRILAAGIIEPTGYKRTGGGQPARLYRYRPEVVAEVKPRRLFP